MFDAKTFAERQGRLLDLVPEKYATILVYGRDIMKRLPTIPYKFQQNSDLLYLTGYDRPSGILALVKKGDNYESVLFLPEKNREAEKWEGFRTDFDVAKKQTGVDRVLSIDSFQSSLKSLLTQTCYISSQDGHHVTGREKRIRKYMDELRSVKDAAEKECMMKACEITHNAILKAIPMIKSGVREGLIDSTIRQECIKNGATGFAFEPITATGKNGLFQYYPGKDGIISKGDSFLINFGAEYKHYAADFARTYHAEEAPREHLDLLMMINDIKNTMVESTKSGQYISLDHIHNENMKMISRVLRKFKIGTGLAQMRELCPDHSCHWIGLDIFDTPSISTETHLKSGNAFTISQAIYFDPSNSNVPPVFKGLSVRFENTIVYE